MIELLAPAANLTTATAALRAGADALYIGGAKFGARRAAANSMADVQALANAAHGYGAKLYMAMNTILFDGELAEAEAQAWQAWEAGVDALIVQDMAFLRMNLPPIALHASTQTFNLTADRVGFLEQAGFSRVILERGATLERIREIRNSTTVELEAFVHGAICVCYSGQCYMGEVLSSRGGNRGGCIQACRSKYNLLGADGRRIVSNSALLSVSDLNLSDHLSELIDAGVTSLKIEGRLKEESYVVNNTAYYNQRLDELGMERTSAGYVLCDFEPNPNKSFSRGFSHYYFSGLGAGVASGEMTKSTGEFIGVVAQAGADYFVLGGSTAKLDNGDGICFTDQSGVLCGTNINVVREDRVYPNRMDSIAKGVRIYRNFDRNFQPTGRNVRRVIDTFVTLSMAADSGAMVLRAENPDGIFAEITLTTSYDPARNQQSARDGAIMALSKSGDTIFSVSSVYIDDSIEMPFIPISELNRLRRSLLEALLDKRVQGYERQTVLRTQPSTIEEPLLKEHKLDYHYNVSNRLSQEFYQLHGATIEQHALEVDPLSGAGIEVMRTPYCIRREMGCCLKGLKFEKVGSGGLPAKQISKYEKLFIENNGKVFELVFHCRECEMSVVTT